jgi:hypothetical protein
MEYYPVSQIPQTLVDNLERWNRKFNKEASLGHLKVLSDLYKAVQIVELLPTFSVLKLRCRSE